MSTRFWPALININYYQLNCELLLSISMSTSIVPILAYQLSLINALNISDVHQINNAYWVSLHLLFRSTFPTIFAWWHLRTLQRNVASSSKSFRLCLPLENGVMKMPWHCLKVKKSMPQIKHGLFGGSIISSLYTKSPSGQPFSLELMAIIIISAIVSGGLSREVPGS